MADYRMTPARQAALEKAQAASALKRRRLGSKSRTSRLRSRKTLALVAVGGVVAHNVAQNVAARMSENAFINDPVNQRIIERHVAVARQQHQRLSALRSGVFPITALTGSPFDADAARLEAITLLQKRRKKKA